MKKYRFLLLIAVLAFAALTVCAVAESRYAVVSGTETLNIRTQPSTSGGWLGRAYEGDWIEIIRTETNGWDYCHIVDTQLYGYMHSNYLNVYGASSSVGTYGIVNNPVATQYLNLRQYPSLSAPVLGIYYNGAVFEVLSVADGWVQVFIDGLQGYFRSEYVTLQENGQVSYAVVQTGNSGKLNLRSQPSLNGAILSQVANGASVTVLLKGNLFDYVEINGIRGFAASSFLQPGTSPSVPAYGNSGVTPVTKGYVLVNVSGKNAYLNLRAQSSLTAKVLAQYKTGIRLEVIAYGETWCKVYGRASGNIGYVMTQFVRAYQVAGPTKTVQNSGSYVNLRTTPNIANGNVAMRVYSGTQVTVLVPGDEWSRVRVGNTEGYMMTAFLQ